MKRNLLFINVFLLFTCAFVSFFFYVNNNSIDGSLIIANTTLFRKTLGVCALQCLLALVCSIFLGRLPKKSNSKVDCVMIEFLLLVLSVVLVELLLNKDSNFIVVYNRFLLYGICSYVLLLAIIATLKIIITILFKKDLSLKNNQNIVSHMSQLATAILLIGGLIGLFVRAYYLQISSDIKHVERWTDYFYLAGNTEYIILFVYSIIVLTLHELVSIKTKKGIGPVVVFIVSAISALLLQLVLVDFSNKIPQIGDKYKMVEMVSCVFLGGYGLLAFVLLLSYSLRPFMLYLFSNLDKKELERNEEYATKEDFILVSEALVKSNKARKIIIEKMPNDIGKVAEDKVLKVTDTTETKTDKIVEEPHYETELVTTITRGFKSKLIRANDDLKNLYNDLLNQVNHYKRGNVRHSFSKDTLVLGRTKIAVIKISSSSKALFIYFNLDKDKYLSQSKYHLKDYSEKKSYQNTPLRLRVRSERSMKYAKELLELAYLENNAEEYKKEREAIDYLKELAPQTDEQMIENGLIKKKVVEETYLVEPVYEEEVIKEENEETSDSDDEDDDEEE